MLDLCKQLMNNEYILSQDLNLMYDPHHFMRVIHI